jgi:hypothetical protein
VIETDVESEVDANVPTAAVGKTNVYGTLLLTSFEKPLWLPLES